MNMGNNGLSTVLLVNTGDAAATVTFTVSSGYILKTLVGVAIAFGALFA